MSQRVKILLLVLFNLLAVYLVYNMNERSHTTVSDKGVVDNQNIIPRRVLFGSTKVSNVKISPDGKFISYISPIENLDGISNVVITQTHDRLKELILTNEQEDNVQHHTWAFDNEHILYTKDVSGDEKYHLYSINITTKETKDLTPFSNVNAQLLKVSHKHPNYIIAGLNNRDPRFFDLYKIHITTGEMTLLLKNNKYLDFTIDDDLKVRFATKSSDNGNFIVEDITQLTEKELVSNDVNTSKSNIKINNQNNTITKSNLKQILEIKPEEFNTVHVLDFTKDGKNVYISDSRNSDTAGLFLLNLKTNAVEKIYLNDDVDIGKVIIHRREKIPEIVFYTKQKRHYEILNKNLLEDFYNLSKNETNKEIDVTDRTLNDNLWIIAYSSDISPTSYYLYNRVTKNREFLFTNNPELSQYKLAPMHPVTIKARDGLSLESYLTLPLTHPQFNKMSASYTSQLFNTRANTDNLSPMIVLVHGGPIHRDYWEMNPIHQWAASRGYAILSVNYRGSSGFGKNFLRAGFGEWGKKMHTDIIDAVEWAINNKITSRDKIAILGGSYGGYESLMAVIESPNIFNCAVDIVGPTDLAFLAKTVPPYWKPMKTLLNKMLGGDIEEEKEKKELLERSPISHIDKITKPLLIVHGANDPRVNESQVSNMVKHIAEKDVPVVYLLYPNEGHQFRKIFNKITLFTMIEYFLAYNLKVSTIEDIDLVSMKKSSIIVKYGKHRLQQYSDKLKYILENEIKFLTQ